jgi:SWI/SNF-related matrix-associated actin-dependent regulator 1 of chromatin subfamily A
MLITSKFPGTCTACNKSIAVGERVSWVKGVRGAKHASCSDEGKAVAVKVEASRATDAEIDVPAPDGLAYLPYQRAGVAYAAGRKGVLIADEMGLGKTIQALGAVNADATVRSVLVIAPKSLTLNWIREAKKWLTRPTTIQRADSDGDWSKTDLFLVASYDEAKKFEATLAGSSWDLVIVDEAHWCKNPKAQRTKTVRAIAKRARRVIALTGTPIANRPIELWPLLQMIDAETWDPAGVVKGKAVAAGEGAGFFRFAKRFCNAHAGRYGWDFSGASNLPELQEKLRASCMVRRLKKDVLKELPTKRRQVVEIPANGSTRAVEAETAAWNEFESEIEAARVAVELARAEDDATYEAAVKRLSDKTRVAFTEISRLRHETALAKVDYVVDHVKLACEDDTEHKVVVMAHHKDVVAAIAAGLADLGVVTLTGDTDLETRQANVDRFQTDATCRVFVGSIMAAGVGITLTAASHVVFAELDWVPGNITQAEDRCHRIGQTESVLVQHLVFDKSLDARMAHVLVTKQAVADAGLDVEPVVTPAREQPATAGKRAELDAVAAKLSPETIVDVHTALQLLAGVCDGAHREDGQGFSKIDVQIGHSLATAPKLTARQAALGLRLVRKYRRQLGGLAEKVLAAA